MCGWTHPLQELQLFLTKKEVAGGYLVLARSGSTLQQLQLTSTLSRWGATWFLTRVAQYKTIRLYHTTVLCFLNILSIKTVIYQMVHSTVSLFHGSSKTA